MRLSDITTQKAKQDATLPDMEIPKINQKNFEDCHNTFTSTFGCQTILSEISLDYLLLPIRLGDYKLN